MTARRGLNFPSIAECYTSVDSIRYPEIASTHIPALQPQFHRVAQRLRHAQSVRDVELFDSTSLVPDRVSELEAGSKLKVTHGRPFLVANGARYLTSTRVLAVEARIYTAQVYMIEDIEGLNDHLEANAFPQVKAL